MFEKKYNVAVFGADGMLGYEVVNLLNSLQLKKSSHIGVVKAFGREADISKFSLICKELDQFTYNDHVKYDIVVNCAAMTDVNKIENDKAYRDKAYNANVIGPTYLAMICKRLKMKLVHVSTDYVFSEKSAQDWKWPIEEKYTELHAFHKNNAIEWPVNIYGMQKLIAEQEIARILPQKQYAILRTSWLYGMHNNKSFVHKFLKNFLLWKAKHSIAKDATPEYFTLPDDQASVPTCTTELAAIIYNVIKNKLSGTFPACGFYDTSLGDDYAPTWFKFGQYILYEYDKTLCEFLKPVSADDPSKPKFSRMFNVDPKLHEKFYGSQFPATWKESLTWFINNNKLELDQWLQSQGCFDEPNMKDDSDESSSSTK